MVDSALVRAAAEGGVAEAATPAAGGDRPAADKALRLKHFGLRLWRLGIPLAACVFLAAGGFAIVASAQPNKVEIDLGPRSVYYAIPEITTTLQTTGKRARYIRLGLSFEVAEADLQRLQAQEPVILDFLQDHLRGLTPADLAGKVGAEELREAIRRRADASIQPKRIRGVLFTALLVD